MPHDLKDPDDITGQVSDIRDALYRDIIAHSHKGLFVYIPPGKNLDMERATSILEGMGFGVIKATAPGIDAAKVNAYMQIIAKSNIELSNQVSQKIPQQKLLEFVREGAYGSGDNGGGG